MTRRLVFEKGMDLSGVTPLPQYFEEFYTNTRGLAKLGLRGDRHYLSYSKNGRGAGYYETREQTLSAESTYKHFRTLASREAYLTDTKAVIAKLKQRAAAIDRLDLNALDVATLAKLFLEANQAHGNIYSYFVVTQPYRMRLFEGELKYELSKRVATSRIDHYATLLATSERPTIISQESTAWWRLMLTSRRQIGDAPFDTAQFETSHPAAHQLFMRHFEKYKSMSLGDGIWDYQPNHFLDRLTADLQLQAEEIVQNYRAASNWSRRARRQRLKLMDELDLDGSTRQTAAFLADIGHTRLELRTRGWVPFIRTIIKIDIALSIKLNLSRQAATLLNYMTEAELQVLANSGDMVPETELIRRYGIDGEYLMQNDNGKLRMYYGPTAGQVFRKLVPPINHAAAQQITGSTAVMGRVTGKACVYHWGDDISEKVREIAKHPILIAGQTRPALMPIIRLAKGIVTDEGGITSHAAIVSRELGIPSVIGTIHATSVFASGDLVELDADHGLVRKLS